MKLGVVQSTTRSWSSSILKKGQFSHPDSLNCYSKNPSPDKETAKRTERKERNSSKHYLIICLNESASKTCPQLMTKASRYLSRVSCATHSPNSCFYELSLPPTVRRLRKGTSFILDVSLTTHLSFILKQFDISKKKTFRVKTGFISLQHLLKSGNYKYCKKKRKEFANGTP